VVPDDKPIGFMDLAVWQEMRDMLRKGGFLKKDVDPSLAFRVDFLPEKAK